MLGLHAVDNVEVASSSHLEYEVSMYACIYMYMYYTRTILQLYWNLIECYFFKYDYSYFLRVLQATEC